MCNRVSNSSINKEMHVWITKKKELKGILKNELKIIFEEKLVNVLKEVVNM